MYSNKAKAIKYKKQKNNDPKYANTAEKTEQIERIIPKFFSNRTDLKILELFAGTSRNLTKVYEEYGKVSSYDRLLKTGNSFIVTHNLIVDNKYFDIVDIDPYGWMDRMFPHVFGLIANGLFFLTFPKPFHIITPAQRTNFLLFYRTEKPTLKDIIRTIQREALKHHRVINIIDTMEIGKIWRIAVSCQKFKASKIAEAECFSNLTRLDLDLSRNRNSSKTGVL